MKKIWILMLVLRFTLIILRHPSFAHYDQYNQVLQPAHHMAFGYGNLTWEWIMDNPIRSPLFPWIFSLPYRLLRILELDNTDLLMMPSRIIQFCVSCLFDVFLVKLNRVINGPGFDTQILLLNYTSYVTVVNFGATLINNTQCVLTLIAFYLWHKRQEGYNDVISRIIVVFCFCMRGTSIMFWVLVWPYELVTMQGNLSDRLRFIAKNLLWVALMPLASMSIAYLYYGKPHFVEFNFFYYNFVLDWSSHFGTSGWQNYITQSMVYFFLHIYPLFLLGTLLTVKDLVQGKKVKQETTKSPKNDSKTSLTDQKEVQYQPNNRKLMECFGIIFFVVFFLSINSHKEDRFLTPIAPLIFILALRGWIELPRLTRFAKFLKIICVITGLASIISCLGLSEDNEYAKLIAQLRRDPEVKSIEFFSLAHSTPHFSELHKKIPFHYPLFTVLYFPFPQRFFTDNPREYYRDRMEKFKTQGYPSHIFVQERPDPKDNIVVDREIYPYEIWSFEGIYHKHFRRGNPPAKLYKLNQTIPCKQ